MDHVFKPNDPYLKWPVDKDEVNKKAEGVAFFIKLISEVKNENKDLKNQISNMQTDIFKLRQEMDNKVSVDQLYVKLRQWEDSHNQKFSTNINMIEDRITDLKKQMSSNFQNDLADFRKINIEMEERIQKMEVMYASKINNTELNTRLNEITYKNEECFKEYYTYLKNNYDKAIQKVTNSQIDFERVVDQKLGDVSNLSFSFETKLQDLNKILLSASVIEEVLQKSRKIENLTFAMQDLLKDCQSIKTQIVTEHEKYVEHVGHMTHKVDEFESKLSGFNEKADRMDELWYLKKDIVNYVRKDEFRVAETKMLELEATLDDSTTAMNERIVKSQKNVMAYVDGKLTNLPNKDFISDYLKDTVENVKRDLDAQTDKCIDNLLKSNNLQPLVMKHDEQLKRLLVKVQQTEGKKEEHEEGPSLTGQKLTFCLTCGSGVDAKMKHKYSPKKSDQYKKLRPNSGFKSTQYTETSNLRDDDVSNCLSFLSTNTKSRSLVKNDRHSSTAKNLEMPTNRHDESAITLDYLDSNNLKTVDFSSAVQNDKMMMNYDNMDKIMNKRPNSSRQQPVSKRVLKTVSSMTKEDFYNSIKNSNKNVINLFRKN
eukprot:Mrub_01509.p1 GENE.Mrub_01509~~Mrub_01509.p1  ORF type:complete len:678 (+),score=220.58 Mrub_01509:245-2035(+)